MTLTIDKARKLAGCNGRVFGDREVFLYDWKWHNGDAYHEWMRELLRSFPKIPHLHSLNFWFNVRLDRFEALMDAGHLGGWPYYVCVAWLSRPKDY